MKIAIVHSFYRSGPSGENLAVQMQANALAEAGHEVQVISRSTDDFINHPWYSLASGLTVATGLGPSPLPEINGFDPDIVHVHNLFPNWGDHWLEKLNKPLVATFHNFRPFCAAGTLNLNGAFCDRCPTQGSFNAVKNSCYGDSHLRSVPLAIATRKRTGNALLERADQLIFLSPLARDTYAKYAGESISSRSVIVPNFVNPPEPASARPDLTPNSWIFVGRLSKEKGVLPLIEHWPTSEKLEIVGDGPQKQEIENAIRGRANITFSGPLNNFQVLDALRRSKGLVFPSVCLESAPSLVYLEALSIGVPVVALAGNAVAEDIGASNTGVVFDSLERLPEALKEAELSRETLVLEGRERFSARFSVESWIQSISETYERAISTFQDGPAPPA